MDINMCLVCDNGYVMPTVVAIYSVKRSIQDKNNKYNIYVLCKGVTEENLKKFSDLEEDYFKVNVVNVEEKEDFSSYKIEGISATPTSIYKFFIPEILSNLDKILYIDGDIIVKKDLSSLYSTDVEEYYVAAVKDSNGLDYGFNDYDNYRYFNAGVMLLNLKKMREDKTAEKLLDYRKNGFNKLMDQDALNYVLKDKCLLLPFEYNTQMNKIFFVLMNDNKKNFDEMKKYWNISNDVSKIRDIVDNAYVLHYTTVKPWKFYDIFYSDIWYRNYIESPCGVDEIVRESYSLHRVYNSKTYKIGNAIVNIPKGIKTFFANMINGNNKILKKYKTFLCNFYNK